jgi:hypothetical protein
VPITNARNKYPPGFRVRRAADAPKSASALVYALKKSDVTVLGEPDEPVQNSTVDRLYMSVRATLAELA